jgi:hypothetical protein
MPDFHEFHVIVREIFVKTVVVHARDDDDAKMRVNGGQGTVIDPPKFLVQLNPEFWEVLPPSVDDAAEAMQDPESEGS